MKKRKASRGFLFAAAISAASLCLLLIPSRADAQEAPRLAVFGGYSHLRFDSRPLGFADYSNLNGAFGGFAFNLTRNFGAVAEIGQQYGSHLEVANWLVGPQVYYHRWGVNFFGHVLFGQGQTRVDLGTPVRSTGRATAGGGGFDIPIGHRLSIRAIQADYISMHSFDSTQGNLRLSTGVVFGLGAVGKK